MKARPLLAFFLCAAAVLYAAAFPLLAAAAPAPIDVSAVDELFAAWSGPDTPGCAVTVVRDGATVLARGYGVADLENGRAITPNTVFRLGAASKIFTAAAIEAAAAKGSIRLEQDVRKHVPELPEYQVPITVRMLLDHASGLPDYRDVLAAKGRSGTPVSEESALMGLALERFPRFEPGTRQQESDSDEFVMAILLERATTQSLRDFAAQNLFRPLDMTQTAFLNPYRVGGDDQATSYARAEGGGFQQVDGGREMHGPGGVESSAADLTRWLIAHPAAAPGERVGAYAGFRTALVHRADGSVACLCNLDEIDAPDLARKVADLALEPAP